MNKTQALDETLYLINRGYLGATIEYDEQTGWGITPEDGFGGLFSEPMQWNPWHEDYQALESRIEITRLLKPHETRIVLTHELPGLNAWLLDDDDHDTITLEWCPVDSTECPNCEPEDECDCERTVGYCYGFARNW